jgi:hypothetical protein
MKERNEILLGNRVSKRLHGRLIAEQKRLEKETKLKLSLNQVVRLLLEKGLDAKAAR